MTAPLIRLPDWEDDLRRCIAQHAMPGIRLHPNYHGYGLDESRFLRILQAVTSAGRFLQIAAAMEQPVQQSGRRGAAGTQNNGIAVKPLYTAADLEDLDHIASPQRAATRVRRQAEG